jgi:hypothetical protein
METGDMVILHPKLSPNGRRRASFCDRRVICFQHLQSELEPHWLSTIVDFEPTFCLNQRVQGSSPCAPTNKINSARAVLVDAPDNDCLDVSIAPASVASCIHLFKVNA